MTSHAYDTRIVVYRNSIDGRFVTAEYAAAHPRTTEKQHIRVVGPAVRPPSKKGRVDH